MNFEARQILPDIAFNTFFSRLQEPTANEGFDSVQTIDFKFDGTDESREIWGKHWT
jgi:bifunctional polynucleotide phosphatase/kinase